MGGIIISKLILLILYFSSNIYSNFTFVGEEINIFTEPEVVAVNKEVPLETFNGPMTAYGPDCTGCIGITASGYNVLNTIYYDDNEYGIVRILAADPSLPFGTIIKISNLNGFDDFYAIVLDRGSAIGFNRSSYFDLLYHSEAETSFFGRQNASFSVLRRGF